MKKLSLALALLAIALAAYLEVQLSRATELLHRQNERLASLVPLQSSLASLNKGSQDAVAKTEASQADLVRELQASQKALALAEAHLALETARSRTPAALHLGKGSYTLDDGTVVYGPDAQLRLPNGMLVTSPTGVMVSDASLTHIDGDLRVQLPNGFVTTTNGFLSVEDGHVSIKGDDMVSHTK